MLLTLCLALRSQPQVPSPSLPPPPLRTYHSVSQSPSRPLMVPTDVLGRGLERGPALCPQLTSSLASRQRDSSSPRWLTQVRTLSQSQQVGSQEHPKPLPLLHPSLRHWPERSQELGEHHHPIPGHETAAPTFSPSNKNSMSAVGTERWGNNDAVPEERSVTRWATGIPGCLP